MVTDEHDAPTKRGLEQADTEVQTGASPAQLGTRPSRAVQAGGREEPGTKIGRFIIEGKLGEGGVGVVLAGRDPDLQRRVAIKILRSSAWSERDREVGLRRLQREAKAAARLSHPNVIVVHEVGLSDGDLYVAMEHVDGGTLAEWCAAEKRPWRQVVETFVRAGRGLAAAHAAGIVHRDFKPGNVLVGIDGRIRVTDFGLASTAASLDRETREPAGEPSPERSLSSLSTCLTQTGSLLGTPRYMAPEQHRRERVDASADQFAYCVALYHALYDAWPFAGRRLSELAENVTRGRVRAPPSDAEVPARVRDVVLRGLAPNPADRFPSMEPLLDRLQRATTAPFRRKLAAAAALIAIAIAAGIVLAFVALPDSTREVPLCKGARSRLAGVWDESVAQATREAFAGTGRAYAEETFQRVRGVLDDYASRWAAMHTTACEATHVERSQSDEVLDLRMRCLERMRTELKALAALLARAPDVDVLDEAVKAASGLPPLEGCADIEALRAAVPPPADPELRARVDALNAQLAEATALDLAGKYKEGLELARTVARESLELGHAPTRADALFRVGVLQSSTGNLDAAEQALREAVRAGAAAKADFRVAEAWTHLLYVVGYQQGRFEEAMAMRDSAEAALARAGDDPQTRARLHNNVAAVLGEQGKFAEAREHNEKALALREKLLGPDHPLVALSLNNLGSVLYKDGKFADARPYFERALAVHERAYGPNHPDLALYLNNFCIVLTEQGELDNARPYCERSVTIREQSLGPDHPDVAQSLNNLGRLLYEQNRLDEALPYYQRTLAIIEKSLGPDHVVVAYPLLNIALILMEQGKPEEALPHCQRALAVREKAMGPDHPFVARALTAMGSAHQRAEKPAEAIPLLERALAIYEKSPSDPHAMAATRFGLAQTLWEVGRDRARALELAEEARRGMAEAGVIADEERAEVEAWLRARER